MLNQAIIHQIHQYREGARLLGSLQLDQLLAILLEVAEKDETCSQQISALFVEPAKSSDQESGAKTQESGAQTEEKPGAQAKEEEKPGSKGKAKTDTGKKTTAKKSSRKNKAPAVLNPLEIYATAGEEVLREELEKLEYSQLKDIIDEYELDPLKQYTRTRKKETLMDVIIVVSRQRATKGDGFI